MISAREALVRLQEGNRRYASDAGSPEAFASEARRRELAAGQAPFAIILGCSDSRVPAELVFNQGLGDLFVIRVAGNIVASSQVGSVEFAAARFGTRLVVVLGHSQCGAILATLEELRQASANQSPHLRSIVDRVRPRCRRSSRRSSETTRPAWCERPYGRTSAPPRITSVTDRISSSS